MRKFELKKLVRDKIVPDMQALGQQVTFRKLNDTDFMQALVKKLHEEASELKIDNKDDALKELADVLEVIEALATELGTDFEQLRTLQAERRAKRGGFKTRTYVEAVAMADDDPWAAYYAKEPNRFKEITE